MPSAPFGSINATRLILSASATLGLHACAQTSHELDVNNALAPYMAVNAKQPNAFPEASNRGSFLVVTDCVVFKRSGDGLLLTPIFPNGSRIVPDDRGNMAIFVRGSKVPIGRELRLGGGYLDVPAGGDISLQRPVPGTCPKSFWLIGTVRVVEGA